ncbi:MAG: histidinol-phosphate transaminase [Chitinophagaceae bacterium]
MFNLQNILRPNIQKLVPYSSARDEFSGEASIYLDANENSLGSPTLKWYNRYPDPLQLKVKEKLSAIKGVPVDHIFLGNGSDEPIDIVFRAVCTPGVDNIIICPPTYGMYEVSANINDVAIKKVPLTSAFQLDLEAIEHAIDPYTKIIFICSPNNPTGNSLNRQDIEVILNNFDGLVVVDEAYINFSKQRSFTTELNEYPNLVVLQTLSKAWGMAGVRIGMAFASKEIISIMNKIKAPYNISEPAQEQALSALEHLDEVNDMIRLLISERTILENKLAALSIVEKVYPSDTNFLLVKMIDGNKIYQFLSDKGIIVRNRSSVKMCENSLRITIGTPSENLELMKALEEYQKA